MLRALLVGPEDNLVEYLRQQLQQLAEISISDQSLRYPLPAAMTALLEEAAPDVVLLNLADFAQARQTVNHIVANRPHLPVIAVHTYCDQDLLRELMQLGVRELWFPPLQPDQMRQAAHRLLEQRQSAATSAGGPSGDLIAFLPARGGSGATTIAVHTAMALPKNKGSVLLADFDFHNSVLSFWLKLDVKFGLAEALENAHRLDPILWKTLVQPMRQVDVLAVPPTASLHLLTSAQTQAVLEFARQTYPYVLVDLPEAVHTSCWDILDNANHVLIVATPEMASLHLAHRKVQQLQSKGISKKVIRILLNRASRLDLQPAEVEKSLGIPVMASFPNDYRAVRAAFADGKCVPASSKLGAQFAQFASALAGQPPGSEPKSSAWTIRQIFSSASP